MTCVRCNKTEKITQKLGRCQRCMNQLTVLSILSWGIWWLFFKEDPRTINAIALMMAACAFSGLLSIHLVMKFVILLLRKRNTK
ncbi:DUF3624 domain-containing protein [Vibrio gallaecicus]|uniref:DUF3624 domain-containing protein n=1 Tax=Vibrio gallaecicus TaxID=552386 RepID=A0ABV4N6V5_9VIBR